MNNAYILHCFQIFDEFFWVCFIPGCTKMHVPTSWTLVLSCAFFGDWCRCSWDVSSLDAQHVHPVLEHPSGDAKHRCGMGLYVTGSHQGLQQELPFKFLDRLFEREAPPEGVFAQEGLADVGPKRHRNVIRGDRHPLTPDAGLLEHILKLSDVAWPMIPRQDLQRFF